MSKRLATAAVVAAGVALAPISAAQAVVIDFVALAAGNERGVSAAEVFDIGGIQFTLSANNADTGPISAYLDDLSGGRPGGLGACNVLTTNDQCAPSSDDNVTGGANGDESVTITFINGAVNLTGLSFNDSNHNQVFPTTGGAPVIDVTSDGTGPASLDPSSGSVGNIVYAGITSITFLYNNTEFYVSALDAAPVPVPAALPMLGAALAGLGFVARKRRNQA